MASSQDTNEYLNIPNWQEMDPSTINDKLYFLGFTHFFIEKILTSKIKEERAVFVSKLFDGLNHMKYDWSEHEQFVETVRNKLIQFESETLFPYHIWLKWWFEIGYAEDTCSFPCGGQRKICKTYIGLNKQSGKCWQHHKILKKINKVVDETTPLYKDLRDIVVSYI